MAAALAKFIESRTEFLTCALNTGMIQKDAPCHAEASEAATKAVIGQMIAVRSVPVHMATGILRLIDAMPIIEGSKEVLHAALRKKIDMEAATDTCQSSTTSYIGMQEHFFMFNYLHEKLWHALQHVSMDEALSLLASFSCDIGLINPNEKTVAALVSMQTALHMVGESKKQQQQQTKNTQ